VGIVREIFGVDRRGSRSVLRRNRRPQIIDTETMVGHSEVIRVVCEQLLLEKSFELRTARYAGSHLVADSVITQVPADHFQPQNRLAFAFRYEWRANRKGTDCTARTSGLGVKFSGGFLLSATYGHVEA
jgi:hypothetical protein